MRKKLYFPKFNYSWLVKYRFLKEIRRIGPFEKADEKKELKKEKKNFTLSNSFSQ